MKKIELEVGDGSRSIDPVELGEFLFLLKGVSVGLEKILPNDWDVSTQPRQPDVSEYVSKLKSFTPEAINSLFDRDAKTQHLIEIESITKNSPMVMILLGCIPVLVIAVVISGGELSLSPVSVKAKLRPLADGIKALKDALGLTKKLDVGYGVREATIKLTPEQFKTLMLPINGEGGFQTFLRGLQHRVNKQTRELTLSQEDLERIYRAKAFPQKGGFQGRFEKIFSSQFPEKRLLKR